MGCATLHHYFPRECAKLVQLNDQYVKRRKDERITRACNDVTQIVLMLHAQSILPSAGKVEARLTAPGYMRLPEVKAAFHAIRRKLGYDK
jgi:hypothetical protein